jgi:hypothetical protein
MFNAQFSRRKKGKEKRKKGISNIERRTPNIEVPKGTSQPSKSF